MIESNQSCTVFMVLAVQCASRLESCLPQIAKLFLDLGFQDFNAKRPVTSELTTTCY